MFSIVISPSLVTDLYLPFGLFDLKQQPMLAFDIMADMRKQKTQPGLYSCAYICFEGESAHWVCSILLFLFWLVLSVGVGDVQ